MTIRIPEHLERFVHDPVQAGRYSTETELRGVGREAS
jgi:Arc/MetJ-type ribon-helix-helix transcriptional regulator